MVTMYFAIAASAAFLLRVATLTEYLSAARLLTSIGTGVSSTVACSCEPRSQNVFFVAPHFQIAGSWIASSSHASFSKTIYVNAARLREHEYAEVPLMGA